MVGSLAATWLCKKVAIKFGIVDKVIPEPPGGAHLDYDVIFKNVDKHLNQTLKLLEQKTPEERIEDRYLKFRKIGVFQEK